VAAGNGETIGPRHAFQGQEGRTMARSRLVMLFSVAMMVSACAAATNPSSGPPSAMPPTSSSPTAAVVPSPAPSAPSAIETTEPSAAPIAQPTAPIGDNRDAIAEVVVDGGVRVRSLPSVGVDSDKYEPLLRRGDEVFVIGGPVAGDGYDWYLVQSLIDGSQGPFGWVSFASRDGEPWIEDVAETDCPTLPNDARRLGVTLDEVLIHCFGRDKLEFEIDAAISCHPDVPSWIDHDWLGPDCTMLSGDACGTCGLRIAAHPDADVDLPEQDHAHWTVRGHFDDPASSECTPAPDVTPAQMVQAAVHACRSTFVLTKLERLDS
jgi:hypothetical protein